MEIPAAFLERMQRLLGDDYPAFLDSYNQPPVNGLRFNTLKVDPDFLKGRLPFDLSPLPWSPAGYSLHEPPAGEISAAPGKHPYHAAGLYYIQEPSAMAVAGVLNPQPGERVLDLCAAPGGKATHLAALMENQGLLVANETHPQRVWELAKNLERWGTRHTLITQESPLRLADHFGTFFDRVLVDAPCSGEGMFRKGDTARREWSPDLVGSCALRQSAILEQAVRLVRPGGWLAYSTCTFNPQENEAVIANFLERQPEFELVQIDPAPGYAPGHPEWLEPPKDKPELQRCVRLWPHLTTGEGHFVALLHRLEETRLPTAKTLPKFAGDLDPRQLRQAVSVWQDFCQANLLQNPACQPGLDCRLAMAGSYLYLIPEGLPDLSGLRVIHPGWWLGTLKSGRGERDPRIEPSHALALGLHGDDSLRGINLSASDPRVLSYLRGDTLECEGENGWVLVCVENFPLGWGKRVMGRLKNYYPRGLRWF